MDMIELRRRMMPGKFKTLVPLTKGIGLNSSNGSQFSSDTQATSGYIPVDFSNGKTYDLTGLENELQCCVYGYNASKQFIHRSSGAYRSYVTSFGSSFFTLGTSQGTGDIKFIRVLQYVVSGTGKSIDLIDDNRIILEER